MKPDDVMYIFGVIGIIAVIFLGMFLVIKAQTAFLDVKYLKEVRVDVDLNEEKIK